MLESRSSMKVIQVAGWSGSGKTTFIRELLVQLSSNGPVGTIKHLGHHTIDLPEGKDTTIHYQAGSSLSIGIDQEKMVSTHRTNRLLDALDLMADSGIRFVVIEGFKEWQFHKVVIGELKVTALLRNPSVFEVLHKIDSFDDYYTLKSLIYELRSIQNDDPGMEFIWERDLIGDSDKFASICAVIEKELSEMSDKISIKIRMNCTARIGRPKIFAVISARSSSAGLNALNYLIDRFNQEILEYR